MKSLSRVRLFATPWTIAYQVPPSMRFSEQEYWSGLPFQDSLMGCFVFQSENGIFFFRESHLLGTSLVVQWFELCAFTVGLDSVPGGGTKISHTHTHTHTEPSFRENTEINEFEMV